MEISSIAPAERLSQIRELLKKNNLDGYIVPHNDAHDSEYIASCDERINFISGFSGSSGLAFISHTHAFLWTDSRYYIQAEKELFPTWVMKKLEKNEPSWFLLVSQLFQEENKEINIGFDPNLINAETCETRMAFFLTKKIKMMPVCGNLVDQVWVNKPSLPSNPVFVHHVDFCGESSQSKIDKLRNKLQENDLSITQFSFLTSKLDEIAYLLNLRGSDIDYNPVFLSYLVLDFHNVFCGHLFTDKSRIEPTAHNHLEELKIKLHDYSEISSFLQIQKFPIYIEKAGCNYSLINSIPQKQLILNKKSPIEIMKAVKNKRELQGLRECHVRDGAAVVAYLAWLKHQLVDKKVKDLTEYSAMLQVEEYRKIQKLNKGLSFDTISAIGPNGAIVHYKPDEKTAALMTADQVYLLDSGGQYFDGTTDITRTVHYGIPKPEEKNAYTRVLLGNLDLERVRWPQKSRINGGELDVLARRRLWEAGLDYGHGTGHGVGYFLNVHEGPHGISRHRDEPLVEGMIVTDEPGYYKTGGFGIRIENCLLVVARNNDFLGFDNITMAPYDRNLIEKELLSKWDTEYIDNYHQLVYQTVMPVLKEMGVENYVEEWLREATKPL